MTKVITARTDWTDISGKPFSFRVWDGKLWRRELDARFYGGSQILTCPLRSKIAKEWLAVNGLYV